MGEQIIIQKEDYKKELEYIEKYWKKLTFHSKKDKGFQIGLPHPFVSPSPSKGIFKNDQFYWDTYFTIIGLISSNKVNLAKGMVENLLELYDRFEIIPGRNRYYDLGRSQIPFLTQMILEIYYKTQDKKWLRKVSKTAEKELKNYWEGELHLSYKKLSRYCDHTRSHPTAEDESGWDFTSRFNNKCLDYLPIDLNCCLYMYERDLSKINKILGRKIKEKKFAYLANKRKKTINDLMWDKKLGFFTDYDYVNHKKSSFFSSANAYALWSNIATKEQAEKIRKNVIKKLEHTGGLANTQKENLSSEFKQWDYPNGWANNQWIVIKGLLNYGFEEDAKRIAKKWLDTNQKVFKKTKKFWEKYDVVKREKGKSSVRYEIQEGFGWTNAIFVRLIEELS